MKQRGYFQDFQLPTWFEGPAEFRQLLKAIWDKRYPDLYEDTDERDEMALFDAIGEVLAAFHDQGPAVAHQRFVYMCWALALSVEPTILSYTPGDSRAASVFGRVEAELKKPACASAPEVVELFPQKVTYPQALHEALDVLKNAARALDAQQARSAVEEALDDCLEGYAVFPGSAGRRDLFDWWVTQVVPAAYYRRLPDIIYTMKWPWPPKSVTP
jgi:hypothetical protein